MTLSEYIEYLFGVATGWLGWTPEVAWNADVREITTAQKALVKWHNILNGESQETPAEKIARQLRSRD